MPETRHANWTSEWEHVPGSSGWVRVVRGADSRGDIEELIVRRSRPGEASTSNGKRGWTWTHRGPDREWDRGPRDRGPFKLHSMSAGYGTTAAAKRAADRYFAQLLADDRLADRYIELIELAGCSPDSPNIAYPGDHDGAAAWLAQRVVAEHGDETTTEECRAAADAYWTRLHTAPSHEVGRRMRL
jgi:hypothetical protein